ncbi:MAG: ROK family transcriptional regulator [Chloroflexi bacterium]|nr:ROK family transcriptional regulator [Chloroflexota bacterium]
MTGNSFYSIEKVPEARSGGATQAETRVYNERLVISLVRRHGQLSKVELTRLTGLAPQTITTIVNRAAASELLCRREPLRGRLGQPSVPYALNPSAAYAFGLKVDHRSADLALIDFVGDVLAFEQTTFDYPMPDDIMAFARSATSRILRRHASLPRERIAGLGIASPFYVSRWDDDIGAPAERFDAWRRIDIRAALDDAFAWPVYLFNDATVSASAELMFGAGLGRPDFLYIHVGHHVAAGLVLEHHLVPGRNRLAGAIGDLPVCVTDGSTTRSVPLKDRASLKALADMLPERDRDRLWSAPEDWGAIDGAVATWIESAAEGLSQLIQSAVAILDIDDAIIDGAVPAAVRRELAKAIRRKLARALIGRTGSFAVTEGTLGAAAPVIGGASIPLLIKYSNDRDLLFKD